MVGKDALNTDNRITVVANPAAGSGRFRRLQGEFVSILQRDGWDVDLQMSGKPGECQSLAAAVPSGVMVCAAGGDGTVNEVVNGILGSGHDNELAVFPCGTGNDFADAVGLPVDPLKAASLFMRGGRRSVDVASLAWRAAGESPGERPGEVPGESPGEVSGEAAGTAPVERQRHARYFCNVVGIGFDATAARRATRWKRLFGGHAYTVAILETLARWQPARVAVRTRSAESGDLHLLEIDRGMFVSVCNGPRSGGAFLLTPDAQIDDGLLDVCSVAYPGLFRSLRLLPGVRRGTHITAPEVTIKQAVEVSVAFGTSQDLHIDGELVSGAVEEVVVSVHPRAITVRGVAPR